MKKIYKNACKENNEKMSRRQFLSIISTLPLISAMSFIMYPRKNSNQDELIFVSGWLLKKKDINVI